MKIREAEILQAAAVAVAAPRYMGAFAYAIGINLVQAWGWFSTVEILSGLAMALLEGWAVAFISRRWMQAERGTAQHNIVAVIQLVLLLMLPLTALPYLVGMNINQPTPEIMHPALIWGWEFIVAAVSPLIAAAVGYVDAVSPDTSTVSPPKRVTRQTVSPDTSTVSPDTSTVSPDTSTVSPDTITQTNGNQRGDAIMRMKRQGMTNPAIAKALNVSVATVSRELKKSGREL